MSSRNCTPAGQAGITWRVYEKVKEDKEDGGSQPVHRDPFCRVVCSSFLSS